MKKILTLLVFLLGFVLQFWAQWPIDTLILGDSVPCYQSSCGCPRAYAHVVPPFNGLLLIEVTTPAIVPVILVRADSFVCLDTCIYMNGDGIPDTVTWMSTDTVTAYICGLDSAEIHVLEVDLWPVMLFAPPLPAPIAKLDTLCPPSVYIDRPRPTITLIDGYTDMMGRYWPEQPYGVSFSWALHEKVLRVR